MHVYCRGTCCTSLKSTLTLNAVHMVYLVKVINVGKADVASSAVSLKHSLHYDFKQLVLFDITVAAMIC